MSPRKTLASALVLLILGVLVAGGLTASRALAPARPGSGDKLIIDISRNLSPREISRQLQSRGVVRDAQEFYWVGKLTRKWSQLKAGEYEVSPSMGALQILNQLTSGVSLIHPLTLREGENMFELAAELQLKGLASQERVLALCRDPAFMHSLGFQAPLPPSLEGYLYPDTYFLNRAMSPEDILRQMVRKGRSVWGAREEARARELGLTRHEVITLASIIEKETGAPHERPMISSVFHNRLRKRMRLQSDPTTIYGIWERYDGNIRRSDLQARNDYNTYTIPALPIGPISNPGKEAIQAALYPAESEFLFFVSHNDGTHEFTRTYQEHNQAVKKFQLDPKARAGKSWRDLNKSSAQR